jgi:signal transduction histidine kinase
MQLNKEKGTGMGLVLSKELLEHINGSIKVKSEEGIGTTVYIDVPEIGVTMN